MKSVLSTFAAAMIATASFAGVALADGDYYNGTSKAPVAAKADNANVDNINTSSISNVLGSTEHRDTAPIFNHESRDNR